MTEAGYMQPNTPLYGIISILVTCRPSTIVVDKNIGTTTKNGLVLEATSNVKLFLKIIW